MKNQVRKLKIGPADDKYEREANNVAKRVIQSPRPRDSPPSGLLPDTEKEWMQDIQQSNNERSTDIEDSELQSTILSVLGGGERLPEESRVFFESVFGYDFSDIRIHTGARADKVARSIEAEAFTIGNEIVFKSGMYKPWKTSGKLLLAHELVHVIQQDAVPRHPDSISRPYISRIPNLTDTDPPIVHRQPTERCIAVGEIPGITSDQARNFGSVVERYITSDYCQKMGCYPYVTEFFDMPPNQKRQYITFLGAHNKHLSQKNLETLWIQTNMEEGDLRRPDILSHRPNRKEFDEIKPNSKSGLRDGEKKVGTLIAFYDIWSLPYAPGTNYRPISKVPIASGHGLSISLRIQRASPGLIVYDLCFSINPMKLSKEISDLFKWILGALIYVILKILASRRLPRIPIPIPAPVGGSGGRMRELADVKKWRLTTSHITNSYRQWQRSAPGSVEQSDYRSTWNSISRTILTRTERKIENGKTYAKWEGDGSASGNAWMRYWNYKVSEDAEGNTFPLEIVEELSGGGGGTFHIDMVNYPELETGESGPLDFRVMSEELSDMSYELKGMRSINGKIEPHSGSDYVILPYRDDTATQEWARGETDSIIRGWPSKTEDLGDGVDISEYQFILDALEFEEDPIA